MSKIFPDAFVIAVVIFATNISLAKMFAKKRGYSVDPNQVCLTPANNNDNLTKTRLWFVPQQEGWARTFFPPTPR